MYKKINKTGRNSEKGKIAFYFFDINFIVLRIFLSREILIVFIKILISMIFFNWKIVITFEIFLFDKNDLVLKFFVCVKLSKIQFFFQQPIFILLMFYK